MDRRTRTTYTWEVEHQNVNNWKAYIVHDRLSQVAQDPLLREAAGVFDVRKLTLVCTVTSPEGYQRTYLARVEEGVIPKRLVHLLSGRTRKVPTVFIDELRREYAKLSELGF